MWLVSLYLFFFGPSVAHTVRWFRRHTTIIPPYCDDPMSAILKSKRLHMYKDMPISVAYMIRREIGFTNFHLDVLKRVIEFSRSSESAYICRDIGADKVDEMIREHKWVCGAPAADYLSRSCTRQERRDYYQSILRQYITFMQGNDMSVLALAVFAVLNFLPVALVIWFLCMYTPFIQVLCNSFILFKDLHVIR